VAQVDRKLKRRLAEDHRLVEVTGRHRERTYDRLPLVFSPWLRHLSPRETAGVLQRK
jgi:hypothetical protein